MRDGIWGSIPMQKKSKSCLFYCIIYYYYFALPSHDLINRPPLALSFLIILGSYNELAEVMEAGFEGKFPKSGMGELGGGMTKVRAQVQAELVEAVTSGHEGVGSVLRGWG